MEKIELMESLKEGINIVDFWAPWCGPCLTLGPILDEVNKEVEGVNLIKVNVDESRELSGELGIRNIPTLIFMNKEGESLGKSIGLSSKEKILENLEKYSSPQN